MEKILSNSEKIRRAEEIYARRKGMQIEEVEEKNNNYGIYKILFRILILINIIISVLCVQNKEYIFKEEFLNKFGTYTNQINEKINLFITKVKQVDIKKQEENKLQETTEIKAVENTAQSTKVEQIVENVAVVKEESIEEKIKKNYSFIKPIEGNVTSFFGDRVSKYQNVTGFHKGIDVGALAGTKIKSAIEGVVKEVSSKGDYRKSFKNRKWRVVNFICALFKNICKGRR